MKTKAFASRVFDIHHTVNITGIEFANAELKSKIATDLIHKLAADLVSAVLESEFAWNERLLIFRVKVKHRLFPNVPHASLNGIYNVRLIVHDVFSELPKVPSLAFPGQRSVWAWFSEVLQLEPETKVIGATPLLEQKPALVLPLFRTLSLPPPLAFSLTPEDPTSVFAEVPNVVETPVLTSNFIADVSVLDGQFFAIPTAVNAQEIYRTALMRSKIRPLIHQIIVNLLASVLIPEFSDPWTAATVAPPPLVSGVFITHRVVPLSMFPPDVGPRDVLASITLATFTRTIAAHSLGGVGIVHDTQQVKMLGPADIHREERELGRLLRNEKLPNLLFCSNFDFEKHWNPLSPWSLVKAPNVKTVKELLDSWDSDPI